MLQKYFETDLKYRRNVNDIDSVNINNVEKLAIC